MRDGDGAVTNTLGLSSTATEAKTPAENKAEERPNKRKRDANTSMASPSPAPVLSESKEESVTSKAFTFSFAKLNLSLEYDAVTLYYKPGCPCLCCVSPPLDVQRYIYRYDADHNLYHRDNYNHDDSHSHIKFTNPLDQRNLDALLDRLVAGHFISAREKTAYLTALRDRYAQSRKSLDACLGHEEIIALPKRVKSKATMASHQSDRADQMTRQAAAIAAFIKGCGSNDILFDTHQYLLSKRFDYLRQPSPEEKATSQPWLGTNANGSVVKTTAIWTEIEKSIALQLTQNIKVNTRFTQSVSVERSQQLSASVGFFSLSRHNPKRATSPTFEALQKGDVKTFERRYQQHFKKY
jgi:hypothetical protein